MPPTKDQCIQAAARAWAAICIGDHGRTVAQAAKLAYQPGGPPVHELERRIRHWRAEQL